MKKYFFVFLLFLASNIYGQAEKLFGSKYISYMLLTEFPNLIFDSTAVKTSGLQIAEINISDSLFYAGLSSQQKKNKKNYSESFFLDFTQSGRPNKGEYTLVTPTCNYSTELKWKYGINFEMLISHNQISYGMIPTASNKVVLTKFNSFGDMLSCKTWQDNNYNTIPADTTLYAFRTTDEYIYDQNFILTRISSSAYFNDSLIHSNSSKVLSYQRIPNSIFYKTQNDEDSLISTVKTIYNSLKHPVSETRCYNGDSLVSTMQYDEKGNLTYYVKNKYSWMKEEYLITRAENGLPSKIIFHGLKNTLTFNFKWE